MLENFKFTLFVLTPVFTASLFWNDSIVERIVRNRQYITYPPEGERPPTNQKELEEHVRKMRENA